MTTRAFVTWGFTPSRYPQLTTDAERERRDANARDFFERYRRELLEHLAGDTLVLEVPR